MKNSFIDILTILNNNLSIFCWRHRSIVEKKNENFLSFAIAISTRSRFTNHTTMIHELKLKYDRSRLNFEETWNAKSAKESLSRDEIQSISTFHSCLHIYVVLTSLELVSRNSHFLVRQRFMQNLLSMSFE